MVEEIGSKDKYLERFNSILKNIEIANQKGSKIKYQQEYKNAIKNLKERFINGKYISVDSHFMDYIARDTINWIGDRGKGWVAKFANEGFKQAIKYGDISMAINAYKIYENLGRGESPSVKNRLLKAFAKSKDVKRENIDFIENVLKKKPVKGIESRVLPSVFGAIKLAGILLGANGFTGAVVGITEKSYLTLGVGLFLAGILGLFISRGKF